MGSINIANQGGSGEYEKLEKKCFPTHEKLGKKYFPTNIMHPARAAHLDACPLVEGK